MFNLNLPNSGFILTYTHKDLPKHTGKQFVSKLCIVSSMVFPVVMYGCESWTLKKTKP